MRYSEKPFQTRPQSALEAPVDVKRIRMSLGYSQRKLASAMSVSLQSVFNWEHGYTRPIKPHRTMMRLLADGVVSVKPRKKKQRSRVWRRAQQQRYIDKVADRLLTEKVRSIFGDGTQRMEIGAPIISSPQKTETMVNIMTKLDDILMRITKLEEWANGED